MTSKRGQKAGVYVHFPYCKRKCDYCAFVSSNDLSTRGEYAAAVLAEIGARGGAEADTLYIGGGTPSLALPGFIPSVAAAVRRSFKADLAEFTVEANPESVTAEFARECLEAGVDRIGMGLQAYSDEALRRAGRLHDRAAFERAARLLKGFGFDNVSSDLILGLPGQPIGDAANAARLFDELNMTHVSVYMLTVEEGTPLYRSGYVPDDDRLADMYELAVRELAARGYERYEIGNFARDGRKSKHNLKYWTGVDYYGIGAAAHSLVNGERIANTEDVAAYIRGERVAERHTLSDEERRTETIMLRLRLSEGLDLGEYTALTNRDLLSEKREAADRLLRAGLIRIDDGRMYCTDRGFLLQNTVVTELL